MFRGTVAAAGLVIDVGMIGSGEARRRALELWRPGVEIRAMPGDRWLVVLPEPVEMRCEQAAGLPLVPGGGGLVQPGLAGEDGTVTWLDGGAVRRVAVGSLDTLPTEGWVDLSDHPVQRLRPLDSLAAAPVQPKAPDRPAEPDLRARAGIGARPRRRRAVLSRSRPSDARTIRWGAVAGGLLVLVAIGGLILALVLTRGHTTHAGASTRAAAPPVVSSPYAASSPLLPGQTITIGSLPGLPNGTRITVPDGTGTSPGGDVSWPLLWTLAAIALGAALRRRRLSGAHAGTGSDRQASRRRGWLARVVLRSPAHGFVRRRHERYLRSLTRKFERRDWHAALREAIGLGSASGIGWLSLRLPRRRESIALRMRDGSGGSVYLGDFAYAHLRAVYLRAAAQLEAAGRVDEAAFVHADLLHDARAAVAYLERNGRLQTAAELAEARHLAPELVVRLWWRAGDRQRAVTIARTRGAFAAAIERLAPLEHDAAVALREEWVRWCRQAGDHLAAVEAAWPESSLRGLVLPDIEAGIALGGPASGQLFAHLASEYPSEATSARALALLGDHSGELRRVRERFIAALARLPGQDQAADRRLSSAAVRCIVESEPTRDLRGQLHLLARRADPLIAADLPAFTSRSTRPDDPVDMAAPADPGQLPVFDAVTLGGRALLVAHGDLGVRLLGLDGRVRARWGVPAHQLVVADNGANALLVRHAGATCEIHRLDLLTRRLRPWAALRLATILSSYDGAIATVVDEDGIALLDVLSDQPRILWRELDREHHVLRINRTPTRLTGLIDVPPAVPGRARSVQLWAFELPSMTLRLRRLLPPDRHRQDAAVFGETAVVLSADDGGDPKLVHYRGYSDPIVTTAAPETAIGANGAAFAVTRPLGDDRQLMTIDLDDRQAAVAATFPAGQNALGLREHSGIVTAWDRPGRVVAADPAGAGSLASLRTAL